LGAARDSVEAFVWFDLAAQQGRRWAAARRDEMAPRLDPAQRAEAQARIERYRSFD
jgi:TPR repeat protein